MLSFDKGKILGYFDGDKDSSLYHEKLYVYEPKDQKEAPHIITVDRTDIIEEYISNLYKISDYDRRILEAALVSGKLPNTASADVRKHFVEAQHKIEELEKKQLIVSDDDKSVFNVVPRLDEHQMITVFGQSGSGKSYWISKFCKEARKIKKNIPIYLISRVDKDEAFDVGFSPAIRRIPIDEKILLQPMEPTDFPEGSIIICDDYAMIADLTKRKAIKDFVNKLVETGRHQKLITICVFHKSLSGRDTMALHSESTMAVLFPRSNLNECQKYLKTYLSFNKSQLQLVQDIGRQSRWLTVTKSYPNILCSEKQVRIL